MRSKHFLLVILYCTVECMQGVTKYREVFPCRQIRFSDCRQSCYYILRRKCNSSTPTNDQSSSTHQLSMLVLPSSILRSLLQYLTLLFLVHYLYWRLPTTPTSPDFSSPSAIEHAKSLVKLGPRIAGSTENEILAVQVILDAVQRIKQLSENPIEVDLQSANGQFHLDGKGMTYSYEGLQNVVVRLHLAEGSKAVLLNCHFDSVVMSPGASDDAIQCGIMLEVLKAISLQSSKGFKHDIIFLFNGAEEMFLPASHGFISSHKWARDVGVFVNLEAAGAGGKEILFQAGPGNEWILEAYLNSAPYPHASIFGQEIFQNNLIPSDTDFRIFRDFGNVSGLDLAFYQNGFVYHTRNDNMRQIPIGSVIRCGENVLAVTKKLAQIDFEDRKDDGGSVFFDFLGLFAWSYSGSFAFFIDTGSIALSSWRIREVILISSKVTEDTPKKVSLYLFLIFILRASTILLVPCYVIAQSFLLEKLGCCMAWYAHVWLVLPLYSIPRIMVEIYLTQTIMDYLPVGYLKVMSDLLFSAIQLEFLLFTYIGSLCGIKSTYFLAMWLIFPVLDKLIYYTRGVLSYIPLIKTFYMGTIFINLIIPIMGRIGSDTNPDFIVGTFVVLLTHISLSNLMPQFLKDMKTSRKSLIVLKDIYVVALVALVFTSVFTSFGFPYSELRPQRLAVHHVKRTVYNVSKKVVLEENGIAIEKMDFGRSDFLQDLDQDLVQGCQREELINCGFPFDRPISSKEKKRFWLNFPHSIMTNVDSTLTLNGRSEVGALINSTFTFRGPTRVTALISPSNNSELINWSLTKDKVRAGSYQHQERSTYFVAFQQGKVESPQRSFWLQLKRSDQKQVKLTIALSFHHMHGPKMISKEFRTFLSLFPAWTFPWSWSVEYKSYDFLL